MADQQLQPPLAGDERFALLCELLNDALADLDLNVMLVYLIDLVKPKLLPVLADQFSLLNEAAWMLAESEEAKRNLIKGAAEIHRFKGTPWAIREVIRVLGFGEVVLQEGMNDKIRDGSITRNGNYTHGDPSAWARYRVVLQRAVTNDQAALLRSLILSVAPTRCRLVTLDYRSVAIRHNGMARRDGQFNHGSS